jgi:hypothetical protein
MTRINSAIPVKSLTDEHLLAEHREIKRLPSVLYKSIAANTIDKLPSSFCLGTGHVKFFLNKMLFIKKRYQQLHEECLNRGFNVEDYSSNFDNIPSSFNNDYNPTEEERKLLIERITIRLS